VGIYVVFRLRGLEVTLIISFTNIWPMTNRHIETSIWMYVLGCNQYVGFVILYTWTPIPLSALSKAWVYGLSLTGITSRNPAGDTDVCECWVLSLWRADQSFRGVLPIVVYLRQCDRGTSTLRTPWSTRGCSAIKNTNRHIVECHTTPKQEDTY